MTTQIKRIRIKDIKISGRHRALNRDKVDVIAASFSEIGQNQPITVRESKSGFILVAGQHRLEAAKQLGWKRICAIITLANRLDRQLWREAENLHRADLTALERAESVTRWAELVARKNASHAPRGGLQPHDKGNTKAARAIGVTRDNVRRSKAVARISKKAKIAAVEFGLDDNESALLKVSKQSTPKAQVAKVHELGKPKGSSQPPLSRNERSEFKRLKAAFKKANKFRRAWKETSAPVRSKFYANVLKRVGGLMSNSRSA